MYTAMAKPLCEAGKFCARVAMNAAITTIVTHKIKERLLKKDPPAPMQCEITFNGEKMQLVLRELPQDGSLVFFFDVHFVTKTSGEKQNHVEFTINDPIRRKLEKAFHEMFKDLLQELDPELATKTLKDITFFYGDDVCEQALRCMSNAAKREIVLKIPPELNLTPEQMDTISRSTKSAFTLKEHQSPNEVIAISSDWRWIGGGSLLVSLKGDLARCDSKHVIKAVKSDLDDVLQRIFPGKTLETTYSRHPSAAYCGDLIDAAKLDTIFKLKSIEDSLRSMTTSLQALTESTDLEKSGMPVSIPGPNSQMRTWGLFFRAVCKSIDDSRAETDDHRRGMHREELILLRDMIRDFVERWDRHSSSEEGVM